MDDNQRDFKVISDSIPSVNSSTINPPLSKHFVPKQTSKNKPLVFEDPEEEAPTISQSGWASKILPSQQVMRKENISNPSTWNIGLSTQKTAMKSSSKFDIFVDEEEREEISDVQSDQKK